MREILFRGKRAEDNKWVYGFVVNGSHSIIGVYEDGHCFCFESVIPETVGQYTGLKDKNGTKIFEGDIIRYAFEDEYRYYTESLENPEDYEGISFNDLWTIDEVVYGLNIGYPAFDLSNHNWEVNGLYNLNDSGQYFYEVIGNIHDNPELLEVE